MILIVDDDIVTCTLLLRVAKLAGAQGHAVCGGYAALSWLECHQADLVILDVDMPDLSGLEVLKRLRSHALLATQPVIMHTGSVAKLIEQTATELGANQILIKGSYPMRELVELIKSFTIPFAPPEAA